MRTREEAHDIVNKAATPSSLSKETMESVLPKCRSPVKVVHASGTANSGFGDGFKRGVMSTFGTKTGDMNGGAKVKLVDNTSVHARKSPMDVDAVKNRQTPEKEFRQRRNSGIFFLVII